MEANLALTWTQAGERRSVAAPPLGDSAEMVVPKTCLHGMTIINSNWGFGKSDGTHAAKLRDRLIASQAGPS